MTELLKRVYSAEHFIEESKMIIELLAEKLGKPGEDLNYNYRNPNEEKSFWTNYFSKPFEYKNLVKESISRSIDLHHPHYMGHQISPTAPIAAQGGFIADFLNNGMGVYEMGVVATVWEDIIIDKLKVVAGYKSAASGFLTSGGSLANLTAMLCARSKYSGNGKKLGVMVSEMAHYSVTKAAMILNLEVIKIPVTNLYAMDTTLLASKLEEANSKDINIICIVGNACSTATGSFDDLSDIADFCQIHNLWFHVDGAHGGSLIFSKKYKYLLKNVERADSFIVDFHKMLMVPSVCTAILFKNGIDSYRTYQHKAEYLWQNENEEWYNLAKRTFECTKFMMSFKVLPMWMQFGDQLFDDFVTTLIESGTVFAKIINENRDFELAVKPQCNIVCFRYNNGKQTDLNQLNSNIRQSIIESGRYFIVQTSIKDDLYLRCSIMNPFSNELHFKSLLKEISSSKPVLDSVAKV